MQVATNPITKSINFKNLVFSKYDKVECQYCYKPLKRTQATVDHYYPTARGGPDRFDNFRISCFQCNNDKGHEFFTFDPGCLLSEREIEIYNAIGIYIKPLIEKGLI